MTTMTTDRERGHADRRPADEATFDRLCDDHGVLVWQIAWLVAGDRDRATRATLDAFGAAVAAHRRGLVPTDDPLDLLVTLARDGGVPPAETVDSSPNAAARAFAHLPERSRVALWLRARVGWAAERIAPVIGVGTHSVESSMHVGEDALARVGAHEMPLTAVVEVPSPPPDLHERIREACALAGSLTIS